MDSLSGFLNWDQIASTIGFAAIVSALVSAFINYVFTMKTLKKGREIKLIEDKLSIYSIIIYNLDNIIQWYIDPPSGNFSPGKTPNDLIQEIVQEIESQLKSKFYLLDPESAAKWIWFKRFAYQVDETRAAEYKEKIYSIRNKLAEKYNSLKPIYENLVGGDLEEIPKRGP